MADRLILINACLRLTGNAPFLTEDDGSPEWNVCEAAYDMAVERLLDEHNWKFAKTVNEVVSRTDPDDPAWQDAYAKPAGCLHVVRVLDEGGGQLDSWKILGPKILVNKDDGIHVEFIEDVAPEQWPGLFTSAIKHFVMAGVYRGLNKDPVSARAEQKEAESILERARPRRDQEEPGRARIISTLAQSRRRRRG